MSNTGELVKMLHDLVDYFTLPGVQLAPAPAVTSYICVLISDHERKFCKQNRKGY
jgi:hypothetical protein